MNSEDISMILSRLDGIEQRLDGIEQRQTEFHAVVLTRLDDMSTELKILQHDVSSLRTSVYWVLAAIGIFLAALAIPALMLSFVSVFASRDLKQKTETPDIESTVRRIVKDMIPSINS